MLVDTHTSFHRYQLELGRARMIVKYRASQSLWPDGIDSKLDRWYSACLNKWTPEYIVSLLKPIQDKDLVAAAVEWAREHPEAFTKQPDPSST